MRKLAEHVGGVLREFSHRGHAYVLRNPPLTEHVCPKSLSDLWCHSGAVFGVTLDRKSSVWGSTVVDLEQELVERWRESEDLDCNVATPVGTEIDFASRFPPRRLEAKKKPTLDLGTSKFESGACDLPPGGSRKK